MERQGQHISFLDHVRGLSIIAVFVFHCLGAAFNRDQLLWAGWFRDFAVTKSFLLLLPITFGVYGVAVFFVVSGFCIHLSFQRNPNWKDFLVRRFFRIYPPYFVALLLFAFVLPRSSLVLNSEGSFPQLISHVFLFHSLSDQWLYGINPSFWSIAVEVQLYALYPLLLVLMSWIGWRRGLLGIAIIECTMRLICSLLGMVRGDVPSWISNSPLTFWFSWSVGAALADAYHRREKLPFTALPLWVLLAASIGSAFFRPTAAFSSLLFSLLTGAWIAKRLEGSPITFQIPTSISEYLKGAGVYSFSIYLLHQPILYEVRGLVTGEHRLPPLALFGILLTIWPIIVVISRGYYHWVELPSISLGKYVLKRFGNRSGTSGAFSRVTVSESAQSLLPTAATSHDEVLATADISRD